jgi:hypothetical protein
MRASITIKEEIMIKTINLVVILLGIALFPVFTQPEETLKEDILVVNVEVPVRVFLNGQPVDNLGKDDFLLYEGKKQQRINGFFIKKRKIGIPSALSNTETDSNSMLMSRYFVLNFRISDYNRELQESLRYVFEKILRASDRLLVFANETQLFFAGLQDKAKIYAKIDAVLWEQAQHARARLLVTMQKIKNQTSMYFAVFDSPNGGVIKAAYDLIRTQGEIRQDYYKLYIYPDLLKYIHLAKHLEKIKREKWVINFYQPELFPVLKETGEMGQWLRTFLDHYTTGGLPHERLVMDKYNNQLDNEMNRASVFMVKDIGKLFYRVDAGFHSIVIPTTLSFNSDNYEYKTTPTSIENTLRHITTETGGALLTSGHPLESLKTIAEKESVYYVLTYAPFEPGKNEDIRIKTKNDNYKVVYDDNTRTTHLAAYLEKNVPDFPAVCLSEFSFNDKVIHLAIKDFLVPKEPQCSTGKISMRLVVKDQANHILYNQKKNLLPTKNFVTISIPLEWLKQGEYFIIGDVTDLLTGTGDMKLIQPRIR